MRVFLYGFVTIALSMLCVEATADVFRCESPENGIVYQQTPCPEPEPDEAEVQGDASTTEESGPVEEKPDSADVVACKKPYRDAIDEIDAEMRREYTAEQGAVYKERLRLLTERMREC
jgi:hypothetical protein